MNFPTTGHGNHLLPTGGGSEVAAPIFIQLPVGSSGAGTGNPPAGPCNLIARFDGWEVIVPLMFIRLEEQHD
jgi:hypothetical protein